MLQLCGALQHIFNLSLRLEKVPTLWKTSGLVLVSKKGHPKDFTDYRPVALTPHMTKTLERLTLSHLRPLVRSVLDPLQFDYLEWTTASSTCDTGLIPPWTRLGAQ